MTFSHAKKLAGAAAASAVIGLLVTPATGQAAPADCNGYQFPGGSITIFYPNINAKTQFDTIAGGTHVDTKVTTVYPQSNMPGTIIGDINGNNIHLKVTREGTSRDYPPLILDGEVGPDDRGHGRYTYEQGSGTWDSDAPLKCIPKPAAPPPQAEPVGPSPKPQDLASQAPADTQPIEAQAPPPEEAAAPPPEEAAGPNGPCIPDPFDLNFLGAC
jgi:hypothetical protein